MEGYKKCPYCGEEIPEAATKCMYCTAWLTEEHSSVQPQAAAAQPQVAPAQPQPVSRKNGIGTAGLVLSIIGLALCWVPVVNLILWFLGFLFSFIGVFKRPKGKAIAGLIISVVSIVAVILAFGALLESDVVEDVMDELFYY